MLRYEGTAFWVIHRGKDYGPFDYDWSKDFHGIELLYAGEKFGEYIDPHQLYADLSEYNLPRKVVKLTTVVLGSTIYGIMQGWSEDRRERFVAEKLAELGAS